MKDRFHSTLLSLVILTGLCPAIASTASTEFTLPEVQLPAIPDDTVNIADYGATADGRTLNTDAFAKAIEAMAERGGGRVIVPAGIWLTGPIKLKSKIDLHADRGALIVFAADLDLYRTPDGGIDGPIMGKDLENVAISGEGIFDGSGDAWRPVKRFKMTDKQWKALLDRGGVLTDDDEIWWPSAQHVNLKRPRLVRLDDCARILIENATFRNAPQFALDVSDCRDLTIRDVTVQNAWYAQNGDGIDLHSCTNVQILRAHVDVGDDALCMKSNRGKPLENVLIRDCTVYHGHGGFVIGSEELGGMRNVRVQDCVFLGTDVGLRFKSSRDRGGLVRNIDIQNIRMVDIKEEAILFDMHYQDGSPIDDNGLVTRKPDADVPAVTDTTPRFQDISIRNVICRGAERAVLLAGLPEMPTRGIFLEDISITAKTGLIGMDAQDINLKDVEILNREGPALHFYNAQRVAVDGLTTRDNLESVIRLQGPQNEALTVSNLAPASAQPVTVVEGASEAAITLR